MTRTTQLLLQFLATMLHPVVVFFPVETIDPVWRPMTTALLSAGLGFIQMLIGLKAHGSNPDGTSARMAYDPTID